MFLGRIDNLAIADGFYNQKRSERVIGLRTLEAATPELHRIALERGTNVVAVNQDVHAGSVSRRRGSGIDVIMREILFGDSLDIYVLFWRE